MLALMHLLAADAAFHGGAAGRGQEAAVDAGTAGPCTMQHLPVTYSKNDNVFPPLQAWEGTKEAMPGTAEHRATHPTSGEEGGQARGKVARPEASTGAGSDRLWRPLPFDSRRCLNQSAGTGMTGATHTTHTATGTASDRPAL